MRRRSEVVLIAALLCAVLLHGRGGGAAAVGRGYGLPDHADVGSPGVKSGGQVPLRGPLCVFVPANGHDAVHMAEMLSSLEAWGDDSTVLFTESADVMRAAEEASGRLGVTRVHVDMTEWREWHQETVLREPKLRRRGATNASIAGRGQLSIPLFYWISQLVKSNDTLVQNCKWFMKCDTDTFLRRELLEREVLNKLDSKERLQVGVPAQFNTRPWHKTNAFISFKYNIGGPGYTFSRGLMDGVDMKACMEAMTAEPVLLIHDDVATGYCATYHVRARPALVEVTGAVASSKTSLVMSLVSDVLLEAPSTECIDCVYALHPVPPTMMAKLGSRDRRRRAAGSPHCTLPPVACRVTLLLGFKAHIGSGWHDLPPEFDGVEQYWLPLSQPAIIALPAAERIRSRRVRDFVLRLSKTDGGNVIDVPSVSDAITRG